MPDLSKINQSKAGRKQKLTIKLGDSDALKLLQDQAKKPRDWYQAMVEYMQNGAWVADKNVKVLYANSSLCRLLGYSFDEIVGKSEYDFWSEETIPRVQRIVAEDRKQGISSSYEGELISKTGEKISVLCLGTPLPDGGTFGILTDLREIKNRETRYRELFDSMGDCVAVYKPIDDGEDFILADFNAAAETIEKVKREKVIGKKVTDIFPGIKEFGLLGVFKKVLQTGVPQYYPLTFYKDNRISGWRENYVYKLPTGEIVAIYDDVTEQKKAEELNMKLRKAMEQSIDGIAMTDLNGDIEFVNPSWSKMHGYKYKELVGKNLKVFCAPSEDGTINLPICETVLEAGWHQGEYKHVRKNGTFFPVLMTTTVLKNPAGKPIGYVCIARDITTRKETEKIINRQIRELQVLYRVHSHIRMVRRLSHVISDIARDIIHVFHNSDIAQAEIVFDNKIYRSSSREFEFVHKMEEPIIISGVKRGVLKLGYVQKMSHAKKSPFTPEERKLFKNISQVIARHIYSREIIERHQKIVKKSSIGIYIATNGILRYVNPRFCKLFKVSEKKTVGQPVHNFILDCCNLDETMNSYHYETKGKQADGNLIDLDMVIQDIDYHGEGGILGHATDITLLKKAEAQLTNFNEELQQLVTEKTRHLELANKRLQSLNELKDEFIAVASHELRSPLTSIRGYLSFLVDKESLNLIPQHMAQYLLRAYNNAESLNHLVNNILDVSRLDTGRFELQKVKTDIIQLVKNIIESLSFQASEKKIKITFSDPNCIKSLVLKLDPIRVSQVLRNLVDNSIKYSKKDKEIIVEVTQDIGWVVIKVIDQGVGIPKDMVEKIFEKFTQLKNPTIGFKGGAGLGLFIAKRIIQLHDGIIRVESKAKQGTIFTVLLPTVDEYQEAQ